MKQLLASFTHFIKEVLISHVGLSFHILGKCLNLGKASAGHTLRPGVRILSVSVN